MNLLGEVVGINTAQPGRRGEFLGMGFALPAERARRVAADLIAFGRIRRAFLGVQIEPADRSSPDRAIPPGSVKIANVTAATPAAEAGLRMRRFNRGGLRPTSDWRWHAASLDRDHANPRRRLDGDNRAGRKPAGHQGPTARAARLGR